jgi:nucleotide-binding universal stress UspA family protein
VLIIPHEGGQTEIGKRVLIAWKPTREAARAVRDSIALLHKADEVTILTVEPAEAGSRSGEALAAFLARHGIRAALRPDYGDEDDVGDIILSHARDVSADLIVMGAYGRSHMREVILGGATERIIAATTVHTLMSH